MKYYQYTEGDILERDYEHFQWGDGHEDEARGMDFRANDSMKVAGPDKWC